MFENAFFESFEGAGDSMLLFFAFWGTLNFPKFVLVLAHIRISKHISLKMSAFLKKLITYQFLQKQLMGKNKWWFPPKMPKFSQTKGKKFRRDLTLEPASVKGYSVKDDFLSNYKIQGCFYLFRRCYVARLAQVVFISSYRISVLINRTTTTHISFTRKIPV